MCWSLCGCACVHVLRIVSTDKILLFINTLLWLSKFSLLKSSYCFSQLFHYFKRRGQVEDEVGKPLAVSDRCLCCNTVLTLCVRRSKQGHHAARNDWPNTTSFCVSRRSLDPRPPTLERTSGNRRRPRPYPALTLWTVCPSHSLALHFPLTPLRAWRHSVLPHPWKLFFSRLIIPRSIEHWPKQSFSINTCVGGRRKRRMPTVHSSCTRQEHCVVCALLHIHGVGFCCVERKAALIVAFRFKLKKWNHGTHGGASFHWLKAQCAEVGFVQREIDRKTVRVLQEQYYRRKRDEKTHKQTKKTEKKTVQCVALDVGGKNNVHTVVNCCIY